MSIAVPANFLHNEDEEISSGLSFLGLEGPKNLKRTIVNHVILTIWKATIKKLRWKSPLGENIFNNLNGLAFWSVMSCKLVVKPQNNRIDFRNESSNEVMKNIVGFHYRFESFVVEEREETLVYDAGSFLAAGTQ